MNQDDFYFSLLYRIFTTYFKGVIIDEPVKEERTARLRQLGQKYFPDRYDLNADLMKNGPRVAVLDFKIEHITGKKVKEN